MRTNSEYNLGILHMENDRLNLKMGKTTGNAYQL